MKGFIISLCIFSLLAGGIVFNSVYVDRICQRFSEEIDALPHVSEAEAKTSALCAHWEREKSKLSISVSLQTLEKTDAILAELDYAVRFGDEATFEKCRTLAKAAIKQIKENEGLIPKNRI